MFLLINKDYTIKKSQFFSVFLNYLQEKWDNA